MGADILLLSVEFAIKSIEFTLKSVEFTLKSVEFTPKSVEFTLKSVEFTLKSVTNNKTFVISMLFFENVGSIYQVSFNMNMTIPYRIRNYC